MEIRSARPGELTAVMRRLDAALLEASAREVEAAIADGRVLVAAAGGSVHGALVLGPPEASGAARVEATAVRRRRRRRGLGTALVRAATSRHGRLVATFDAEVRPFWASLGFEIEPADEPGRLVGTLADGP